MSMFSNLFGTDVSVEDKILSLIDTHYSSFTRIKNQNIHTDIEGKILLLSSVYEIYTRKEGHQSQSFDSLLKLFIFRLDDSIINTIEHNGVGPVAKYIIERCKIYDTELKYQLLAGKGTMPMGICFCLYKKPLGKYEHLKCIKTKDGYTVTKMDSELFLEYVRRNEGLIGSSDEYSYNDLDVILKFIQAYIPTKIKFEQALLKII